MAKRTAVAALLALLVTGFPFVSAARSSASPSSGIWYGALQVDPGSEAALAQGGVKRVDLELAWQFYEPQPGVFDQSYIAKEQGVYDDYRAHGFDVELDPGLQYPPSWAFSLPGGTRFVDQDGTVWHGGTGEDPANAVTDMAVRSAETDYLQHLGTDFASRPFAAVRVGGLLDGELRYPPIVNDNPDTLWAYDAQAVAELPRRDWQPGTGTQAEARQAIGTYLDNLTEYETWLVDLTNAAFPTAELQLMLPGWGLRPGQVDGAIANGLDGSSVAEQGGNLTGGLDWAAQLATLAANTDRGVAYTTWLDGPDQGNNPQDESPIAYIASVARPLGLGLAGENTGGTSVAIMKLCAQRARQYGLSGVMWMSARILASTSGGLSAYSSFVASQRGGSSPVSPSPAPTSTPQPGPTRTAAKPAHLLGASFQRLSRRRGILRLNVRAHHELKARVQFTYDHTSLFARRTIHRHDSHIRLHVLGLSGHGTARLRLAPMTRTGHRKVISRRVHVRRFGHRRVHSRAQVFHVGQGPARLMM